MLEFAREYINNPDARTHERDREISNAYFQCFQRRLATGCRTCYVEALIEILNYMEKETCDYKLKPGVVLQDFYGTHRPVTNKTMTNEDAQYYLKTNPGLRKFFAVIPDEGEDKELDVIKDFSKMTKEALLTVCKEKFPDDEDFWSKMSKKDLVEYLTPVQ